MIELLGKINLLLVFLMIDLVNLILFFLISELLMFMFLVV